MTSRRLGIVLAVWNVGFALVHTAWALGWRGGVPDATARISERPVFLVYDLLAGALMLVAAGVSLLLALGGLTRVGRGRLERLTLIGSGLALARGVPALLIDVLTMSFTGIGILADTWFVIAGVLGLLLWAASRRIEDDDPLVPGTHEPALRH